MGDTLDDELERLRRQEAERSAVERWNRRYGAAKRSGGRGGEKLLAGNHAFYTAPLAWLRRRRDGEKVVFVEIRFSSGLEYSIRILTDGVRFAWFCPSHLAEVLASALMKRGR